MAETTPPSESTPEPEALPPGVNSHIVTGDPSLRYMGRGAESHLQEPPLPLRPVDSATNLSQWWDVPQPLQQRSPLFIHDGPAEPPFPPPTTRVVADFGGALEFTAAVGAAHGVGFANGVGASIAEGVGSATGAGMAAAAGSFATGVGSFVGAGMTAEAGSFVENSKSAVLIAERSRLKARLAILEAALAARPAGFAPAPRPAGIGHNSGTYLDENLNVDEASIQNLIALLKVPRATAPIDLAKLAEAAQVADPSINKWQERVDTFVTNVLKGAAIQAGKEITKDWRTLRGFNRCFLPFNLCLKRSSTYSSKSAPTARRRGADRKDCIGQGSRGVGTPLRGARMA